jgi:hypothetical protein
MENDISKKEDLTALLIRACAPDFEPKEDDDKLFYAQWLLTTGNDYNKGLKKLAELIRNGDILETKNIMDAHFKWLICEMLDPQGHALDFNLVVKKTGRKSKYLRRMDEENKLAVAVECEMRKSKVRKTAAIKRIAPDRERQAERAIVAVKKRRRSIRTPIKGLNDH